MPGQVVNLARLRIERAIRARHRYRYVKPRVEPEGEGWRIVSPNCSRSVQPDGGDIPIAWLRPVQGGQWQLHAHDDAQHAWVLRAEHPALTQVLSLLCDDPQREFWR